jgi:hypothetical protein
MNELKEKLTEKRVMTPLWIIALFLSLTETVLGVAVTQTNGGIQIALTAFVIGFPSLVAGAFFLILWKKPYVLYAPIEYGRETDVMRFVEAMQRRPLDEHRLYGEIQKVVRDTLTSEQLITDLSETVLQEAGKRPKEQIGRILDVAAGKAVERIREVGFLAIDSRPLLGNDEGRVWQVSYDQYGTISALLDDIWYSVGTLPAFSFREKWVLRDSASGRVFKEMGTRWAAEHGIPMDVRSLKEVGIVPGMTLEVVSPKTARLVE